MRFILVAFLFISSNSFGQWKDYIISVRGDTLNRVDMKGLKQGPWVIHVEALRGEPGYDEQGYFTDDKKDGLWVRFSLVGDKIAEENYRWGSLNGKARYYTRLGALVREENWRAVDPNKNMDTVDVLDLNDPTKVIDRVVVKLTGQTYKHGTWTYYEPEWGGVVKTERYFLDKLQTGNEGDDEIKPIAITDPDKPKTDSIGNKTVVKPQVVLDYEKKNSGKKKVKTRDGQTGR
jgi:hypothetical protein